MANFNTNGILTNLDVKINKYKDDTAFLGVDNSENIISIKDNISSYLHNSILLYGDMMYSHAKSVTINAMDYAVLSIDIQELFDESYPMYAEMLGINKFIVLNVYLHHSSMDYGILGFYDGISAKNNNVDIWSVRSIYMSLFNPSDKRISIPVNSVHIGIDVLALRYNYGGYE